MEKSHLVELLDTIAMYRLAHPRSVEAENLHYRCLGCMLEIEEGCEDPDECKKLEWLYRIRNRGAAMMILDSISSKSGD